MTAVLLSAGKATRLGDRAPQGCKALVEVGGETMLGHWRKRFSADDFLVVCRSEHQDAMDDAGVRSVVCDTGGGPAAALAAALPYCSGPTTVIYADTWSSHLPEADAFCGVAAASGGRNWDVVEDGLVAYRHVEVGEVALVAVGLYRFPELGPLRVAIGKARSMAAFLGDSEAGLADVVNHLDIPFVPVVGWRDVGTPDALDAWRAA